MVKLNQTEKKKNSEAILDTILDIIEFFDPTFVIGFTRTIHDSFPSSCEIDVKLE